MAERCHGHHLDSDYGHLVRAASRRELRARAQLHGGQQSSASAW
jgi:hypothetical protein